jgi:hypothetical protein
VVAARSIKIATVRDRCSKQMEFDIPYAKDENLPSLEDIVKGFETIDALNIGEIEYSEIRKIFFDNLTTVPQLIVPEGKIDIPIYRATLGNFKGFNRIFLPFLILVSAESVE